MNPWILLIGLVLSSQSHAQTLLFEIEPGDRDALNAAIVMSNQQSVPVEVVSSGTFEIPFDFRFNAIEGELTLTSKGERIVFAGLDRVFEDPILDVSETGRLTMNHVEFTRFIINSLTILADDPPGTYHLIRNAGSLVLSDVHFHDNDAPIFVTGTITPKPSVPGEIIYNTATGETSIRNSSFVGNLFGTYLRPSFYIYNDGKMHITNTLFTGNHIDALLYGTGNVPYRDYPGSYIGNTSQLTLTNNTFQFLELTDNDIRGYDPDTAVIHSIGTATTILTNNILAGPVDLCIGAVISNGGNLVSNGSCQLGHETDIENAAANFGPFRFRTIQQNTYPQLSLLRFSPGVDSAIADKCPVDDLNGERRSEKDGNYDGLAACDRGSFERPNGRSLTDGGLSGLYFDPESDGHYVQILDFSESLFIVWNTFDRLGNQRWVYATGLLDTERQVIDAQATTNEGGVLLPNGPPVGATATAWGSLQLTIENCGAIQLHYTSTDPQFGEGQFRLSRLAYADEIGCSAERSHSMR